MAKTRRKGPVIAGIAFMAIFLGALAWSTLGNAQHKVEVCETYQGRSQCRSGAASTKEEAERIATVAACTDLTHGMTEFMQCQQQNPTQVNWKP